jgi:hypothetical protein
MYLNSVSGIKLILLIMVESIVSRHLKLILFVICWVYSTHLQI